MHGVVVLGVQVAVVGHDAGSPEDDTAASAASKHSTVKQQVGLAYFPVICYGLCNQLQSFLMLSDGAVGLYLLRSLPADLRDEVHGLEQRLHMLVVNCEVLVLIQCVLDSS